METYCYLCQKVLTDFNWKYCDFEIEIKDSKTNKPKIVTEVGWICSKHFKPVKHEFIPDRIKEDRQKYFKSMIQPFRDGELSKEYCEAYPQSVGKMIKEGHISEKEVSKAKPVWRDLKGQSHWRKTK